MPARAVLFLRSEREKSFYSLPFSWPHNEGFKANPELLAKQYFYYVGNRKSQDSVKCIYCDVVLSSWDESDDIGSRHKQESPNCPIINLHDENMRLKTFLPRWSKYHGTKAKTKLMAEAGFYYAPSDTVKDCVACYACGLELDHWEKNDDPWEEHRVASIANTVAETLTILEPIQSLPIEDESMQSKPTVSKKKKPVAKRTGRNVKTSKAKAVKSETHKEIIEIEKEKEKEKETDAEITPEKTNDDAVSAVSIEIPASSTSESSRKTRKKKNEVVLRERNIPAAVPSVENERPKRGLRAKAAKIETDETEIKVSDKTNENEPELIIESVPLEEAVPTATIPVNIEENVIKSANDFTTPRASINPFVQIPMSASARNIQKNAVVSPPVPEPDISVQKYCEVLVQENLRVFKQQCQELRQKLIQEAASLKKAIEKIPVRED
ncbi:hypothetical protein O9G_003053 [Rozella allomycis CSF55]|uniref:BIR-domain-containing protein n=1 Tax=Rozella allomycis (strain CSF55) TaxID=988480 RepID=A0A075AMI8_ROZAC|nr:hypothetical protein O9G_003053 [Rozella allomycis CSF55]|eukprot:EPZ30818.1 hypothetical protein O9G_003053 [Rozella allomycis CSF55]